MSSGTDKVVFFRRHQRRHTVGFRVATEAFLADQRIAEIRPRTIREHERELRRYGSWLEAEQLDWMEVEPRSLTAYTRTRANRGPSSRAALIGSLRKFYRWAVEQGDLVASPAEHLHMPRRPQKAPRALKLEDVRTLLTYLAEHEQDGLRQQRDRALMLAGLYGGFRASELAGMLWANVDLQERVIVIPVSKMNKGRALRIHPDLVTELERWKEAQGQKGVGPVFALGPEPIVANRVGKVARRYAKLLSIPLTAHTLRHTFATWSLRRSGNIYAVSKALGHASLKQTEVYLLVDPHDGDPAVASLPPLEGW